MRARPPLVVLLVALATAVTSCGETSAERAFNEYLGRADRAPRDVDDPDAVGVFVDITGVYLFNIHIRPLGEVFLELRTTFTDFEPDDDGGALVRGHFTFPQQEPDAEPLATFESRYDGGGTFQIRSGYVRIEPELSPIPDTAVEVEFILEMIVIDDRSMCGVITDPDSTTFQPLILQLRGTTLGAKRYGDEGEIPVNVPSECPRDVPAPGDDVGVDVDAGGDAGSDAGVDAPDDSDGGEPTLRPPDVELSDGQRADITGRFWFAASVPGLPTEIGLIADMKYHQDGDDAAIDGSLRLESAPGAPAASVFSVPVDENGEFTVVIPELALAVGPLAIVAELALRGVIQSKDFFCGAAAGNATEPLPLSLDGATFGALRIPDDATTEPNVTLSACP